MATRTRIEMDFKQAMAQADEVDEIADRLSDISGGQLGDALQNLAAAWRGENAVSYLGKGARLQDKISASSGELHETAASIRRAARRIYNAEMEALRIAEARDY